MKDIKNVRWARWMCFAVVLSVGCGYIADKDRIKIARVDGDYITRGDLEQAIRTMSADERPIIRTKGDVRRALENLIDKQIKDELADGMRKEGKIHVDRELARQITIAKHPEQFVDIKNPEDYGQEEGSEQYRKQEQEYLIDDEVHRLEAEQAVYLKIKEAVENGTLKPTEQEYQQEYDLRKEDLKHPERIAISGLLIPGSGEASVGAASAVRGRLATGESAEDIASEMRNVNASVIESALENSGNAKYAGFWQQASGAQKGDILGPIYVTGWEAIRQNAQGQSVAQRLPDGVLVCRVTDYTPPVQMTLEEAKPELDRDILYAKMMDLLRKEHGVEIYDDNLPDPSMYETGQSVILQQQRNMGQ